MKKREKVEGNRAYFKMTVQHLQNTDDCPFVPRLFVINVCFASGNVRVVQHNAHPDAVLGVEQEDCLLLHHDGVERRRSRERAAQER